LVVRGGAATSDMDLVCLKFEEINRRICRVIYKNAYDEVYPMDFLSKLEAVRN